VPGYVHAPDAELDSADIEAIERAASEYWEAWYTGDTERLRATLHPDFELRGLARRILDTRTNYIATDVVTQSELVYLAGLGLGLTDPEKRLSEVTVLAATHYVASVKTVGEGQTHLLHLMRLPEGWKIVGAIFSHEGGVIPNQTFDI